MPTKKETVQTLRCQNSKVKVVAVVVLRRFVFRLMQNVTVLKLEIQIIF